jgi:hypothetical protein
MEPAKTRTADDNEDCSQCRSLDCDMLFALLFTLLIAFLLVLMMGYWLSGIANFQEPTVD